MNARSMQTCILCVSQHEFQKRSEDQIDEFWSGRVQGEEGGMS